MNSQDEFKMRRPELKDRLQAAWKRIDALEQENERLRGIVSNIQSRLDYIDLRMQPVDWGSHEVEKSFRTAIAETHDALDGGGGDDE
jgi:predicted nuclease with TOPRIM domain